MRRMFSEKQIEELVKKTDFQDVDLKVKTIEQNQPNWSVNLSDVELVVGSGFSATNIFSRLQVVGAELEVIFTFSVTNTGESTATPSNVQLGSFDIPEKYGERIIDVQGKPLTESVTLTAIAGAQMVNTPYAPSSATTFGGSYGNLNLSHQGTKLFIACYGFPPIGAGASHTYSGRIQLTLL